MAFNDVRRAPDLVPVGRVIVSVHDKAGLVDFVRALAGASPALEVYATGGSYRALADAFPASADPDAAGSACAAGCDAFFRLVSLADYTGQPEMRGGLVKTLDWRIYLGLLAEPGDSAHQADLEARGALAFDMVVGNLYPFAAAAADPATRPEELRQRIDIGGPAMLRAAAKNFLRVAAVPDPSLYPAVLAELAGTGGGTRLAFRHRLAAETFARTAAFDALVAERLGRLDAAALASAWLGA